MIIEIFRSSDVLSGRNVRAGHRSGSARLTEAILKVKKETDGQMRIERYLLSQQPTKFLQNPEVLELLHSQGTAALPVTAVNGKVVKQKAYPTYTDLQRYIVQEGNAE
jgi:hypothetical protein